MGSSPVAVTLITLYINQDEFVLVNNVLKEYTDMKEEIKEIWRRQQLIKYFNLFVKQFYHIVWSVTEKADSKNAKVAKVNKKKTNDFIGVRRTLLRKIPQRKISPRQIVKSLLPAPLPGELPWGKFPRGKFKRWNFLQGSSPSTDFIKMLSLR